LRTVDVKHQMPGSSAGRLDGMMEEERNHFASKFREVPLRYRLSLAFFFMAFLGTFSLVGLAILSQNDLIRQQEQERLYSYQRAFDHNMELQGRWAVSLASNFARIPEISEALAQRDRARLIKLCYPAYIFMKKNYGISQFHFQVLPPRSFLRLHRLYEFGDDLSYRQTIMDTLVRNRETFGLEEGLTGYGIRGVAPVRYDGQTVGTVEIGFDFGPTFLEEMKKQFDVDASFLVPQENSAAFKSFATTLAHPFERDDSVYAETFRDGRPRLLIRHIGGKPYALLLATVENYEGKTVALVELGVNRSETLSLIDHYRQWMLGIGILGMLLSVGGIYIISSYFTRPIAHMVAFAREIALGKPVHRLEMRPTGELRVLAIALDDMLISLDQSRKKIQEYTDNLELMVQARTRALRESEEKYRTLVENVPLVVYRLLGDGKVIFINHYIEDLVGISVRRALDGEHFWRERVWHEDQARIWPLMERCLQEGLEFKAEFRLCHASGNPVFVQGHALPILDEKGNVETVDGFFVNVTDRHRLQQQIIQTEELRTLSEVSARLAHEIRNPLVAAGGFARRLLQSLPEGDSHREKVQIIVQEVARLEKILEKTLAYLKPFELMLERASVNDMLVRVFTEMKGVLAEHEVSAQLNLSQQLTSVFLDQDFLCKALKSLIRALLDYCRPGGSLELRTYSGDSNVQVAIVAHEVRISEDDIEHFFYPFTTRMDPSKTLDLPLAKMIIHKHGGLIGLRRKDGNRLVLNISLPL